MLFVAVGHYINYLKDESHSLVCRDNHCGGDMSSFDLYIHFYVDQVIVLYDKP
jgi:hypothetical protein